MEKLQLLYEQMIEDDELMQELETIMHYSIATMKTTISNGTEIYEMVEQSISIQPIGLIPLDTNEGYLFLRSTAQQQTKVYQYRLSFFERHDEQYRTLKTNFIDTWMSTIANSYENIKGELIRNKTDLPNPAVYCIETNLSYPVEETFLPIAKRSFVKFLSAA
jgi:hypothetical protein